MKTNATPVWTAVCLSALALTTTMSRADETAAPVQADEKYTGTVRAVDPQEHTLQLKGVFFDKKFNLGNNCLYVLPEKNTGSISDVRPGERIRVAYQDNHGVLVADRVEQLPMTYEGMVKAIDPVNHTLTIHLRALDKDFVIANDCRFVLRDNKPGALADIQTGDHVTVTYEAPNDQLTARQIAQTSVMFTGAVVAIDLSERTLKTKEGFSTKKFNLADNCAIVINGKTDGRLDDLKPNERLVVNYDEINGVNVATRIAPVEAAAANSVVTTYPAPVY